ncbi:E1-like protein-activating [Cyathus striatus]|nr:E1-like protein-activating [Cyathus striatus]
MPTVEFAPFTSQVDPTFWHALTDLKIDVLKLSDESLPVYASYSAGKVIKDRETGGEVELPGRIVLAKDGFSDDFRVQNGVRVTGTFKNFNTIEDFKNADKKGMFNDEASKIWDAIQTRSTKLLNHYLLITFADLKKYKFHYWFAFPGFVMRPPWTTEEVIDAAGALGEGVLSSIQTQLKSQPDPNPAFFLVRTTPSGETSIAPVEEYETFFKGVPSEHQTISFLDPSTSPTHPGWPLRNLLTYLRALYPSSTASVRVLAWRDLEKVEGQGEWRSKFLVVSAPIEETKEGRPEAVGWERTAGRLVPKVADLGPMMDPKRLASQAVDLNLKLMRWRILPDLQLEKMQNTRCLLLGAGTLGCYVARSLMAWGVRKITLVDSGRVSFSNPVRQPLFEFEDCLGGGKPKAESAAEALKRVYPDIDATGHTLSIPMPGHPIPAGSVAQTKKDVEKLEALFDEHDAVFLLMDSRESRWLPSVLGKAKGKIVLNAALGFDSYLVMRHGPRGGEDKQEEERLGCYYCNDIVAPTDSLTDRTLDQMCTVTRPGLAPLASATAVEILASLVQHPDGINAAAPPPNVDLNSDAAEKTAGVLGVVPHQVRGFLAQFRSINLVGRAYDKCTGCSETVLKAYETQGFDMLLKAFNDQKYLEQLTGLDKLFDESEAAMESVDWVEEGDEDDF